MVKLYVADISNLPDPMLNSELLHKLPLNRQQGIHKLKQEKSRKQSMGVGLLLQKVLALYHIQDSQVYVDEHGKPMVEGVEFSLSHSGHLVACAVSNAPVGCDVEELRKAPKGVAKRYFSDSEQAFLHTFSDEEYNRAFFQIWTMKESYVKMTGEGLGVPFEAYEVVFKDSQYNSQVCTSLACDGCARVLRNGVIQACHLSFMEMEGHIISICAESSAPVEVIWSDVPDFKQ